MTKKIKKIGGLRLYLADYAFYRKRSESYVLCRGRYKHHKQGYAITSPLHQPDKLLCGI